MPMVKKKSNKVQQLPRVRLKWNSGKTHINQMQQE